MKIHRGRLDKEILADRAQLLLKKILKKVFKNFEKTQKIFSFFWMVILEIFEKSRLFSFFDPSKMTLDFPFENKKKRDFSKIFKFSIQKNENVFRNFLKFL